MEWTHGRPRPPWQSAEVGCRIDIKLFSDAFIRCEFTLWVFVDANFAARVASYGLSQQLVVDAVTVLLVMSLPHHFLCWWSIFPYSSGLENCLILVRLVNQQLAQEHWSLLIGLFLWTNIIFFQQYKMQVLSIIRIVCGFVSQSQPKKAFEARIYSVYDRLTHSLPNNTFVWR